MNNAVYEKFTFTFNPIKNKHNTNPFVFVPKKLIEKRILTIEITM